MALPISLGSGATLASTNINGEHFSFTKIVDANVSTGTVGWSIGADGSGQMNLKGNVTLTDSKGYVGLVTTKPAASWPDPKTFIGLVTIGGGSISAALNPSGTALNTYSVHLTTNTTTTPTSSSAYISSIAISNEVAGTTSSITIQDKQGTSLKLINGISTTALTTAPTIINFQTPVQMISGIDIITSGAVAATVDVWINYYQ